MNERAAELMHAISVLTFAYRASADDWVSNSGLTRQQAFTLGFIEEHQHRGVIAREIAEVSRTTPASVASLLQGLEDKGLLIRSPSPDDSRVKLLTITTEAAALIDGFDDQMRTSQQNLFAPLDEAEQEHLLALLTRLTDAVDISKVPTGPPLRGGRRTG